jgi:uncharacterized protein (DUF1684 family)
MEASDLEELARWRRRKEDDLRQRDGWLALAGLHWLSEGAQSAGSGSQVDIRLPPSAPPRLGSFELRRGQVFFYPDSPSSIDGAPPPGDALLADTAGEPSVLRCGELSLQVIERGHRFGLRVWDNTRPERTGFSGRTWYPPDGRFRVPADFEPANTNETIAMPSLLGDVSQEPLLGTATFRFGGKSASLRAIPADGERWWFLFSDPTNGRTTYPAGRFLVADPPTGDKVVLDFNRAYNPPCAFTVFATCPLPPEGNRLGIPVEAGETYRVDHAA